MATVTNNTLKLKAVPGTCKLTVNGSSSRNVNIHGNKSMCGEVKFTAGGGTWMQLVGCSGSGVIKGTGSNVKINGNNTVLDSDKGKCSGMGTDPTTGAPCPCNCMVTISISGVSVNNG